MVNREEPKPVPSTREVRGSGTDINSNTERLRDPEVMQDKTEEDSFPASDPPSTSPVTGVTDDLVPRDASDLPEDFKDNTAAQFRYGRKSQQSTHHFDRSSRRLEHGNPDVGEIDLGTIEADKPAQPDDHDHYDTAGDDSSDMSRNPNL